MKIASPNRKPFRLQLDLHSGVPVYRQIIDHVTAGIAAGTLKAGDQLPTVRQAAVDLSINRNTITRAYRELEIRGVLDTRQGTGTFIGRQNVERDEAERQRRLNRLVGQFAARAGANGFMVDELIRQLRDLQADGVRKRR